jgi:hypothetical protein
MHFNLRPRFVPRTALFVCAFVASATTFAASPDEAPFLAENDAAMAKMMRAMNIEPSGDVDHDFVAMMVAHHQGAIDMAQAELRYGRNERLRRLAQEIIVTQQQEIAVMRLAIGQPPPSPMASLPQQFVPAATDTQSMSHHSTHIHPEP